MKIKRSLINTIQQFCLESKKMAFISGPRQVGKTTLSNQLSEGYDQKKYITWDDQRIRKQWASNPSHFTNEFNKKEKSVIIVDEIHKSKLWKTQLKGLWDQRIQNLDIIVTGSAQLNVLKKAGDSLVGRFYHFNLHPLTVGELLGKTVEPEQLIEIIKNNDYSKPDKKFSETYEKLKKMSGFPEPFLMSSSREFNLWQKTRLDRIIREDLRDLSRLPDLSAIEVLASLLPEKVGSALSIENLRQELETSYNTIKRWLLSLEAVYYHYTIRPYSNKIANSLKKEPKIYLYDYTEIQDEGALYENIIANHLYKSCHYWTDAGYGSFELHYVRTKQQIEIDFLITCNKKPWLAIESKKSFKPMSNAVINLHKKLNCPLVILTTEDVKPTIDVVDKSVIAHVPIAYFLQLIC